MLLLSPHGDVIYKDSRQWGWLVRENVSASCRAEVFFRDGHPCLLPALSHAHNGLSVALQLWTLQHRSMSLWLSKMMDREISVIWQVSFKTSIYLVRYGENIPLPFTL